MFLFAVMVLSLCVSDRFSALKTRHPPCCRDLLSEVSCRRLIKVNATVFAHRCNQDAEFRLIQCCQSCNRFKGAVEYDRIAESLVATNCFDRYGEKFCKRYDYLRDRSLINYSFFGFVDSKDVWETKTRNCDGISAFIAFRTCRSSAGFCDFSQVKYTLSNALEACRLPE
ncbi:hypothetical protein M3Y95_00492700 [Aphelenchoides besseyi]|nr:hypothetical protein M3Y95_00492700 [Aphelenchoides besseyi]